MQRYPHRASSSPRFHFPKIEDLKSPWENLPTGESVSGELPSYFRCTTQKLPSSADVMKQMVVPLAIIMEPCNVDKVPLLDYTQTSIPRCQKCESYLSYFCLISDNKESWVCSLCGMKNVFPQSYVKSKLKHEELISPVYDMKAPRSYIQKPQIMRSYLFLIDVSQTAIDAGFTRQFTSSIKASLDTISGSASIVIMTFSGHVSIYDLNRIRESIILEPTTFVASPNLVGVLSSCRKKVEIILDIIAAKKEGEKENCFGSALAVATSALRIYGGLILASCCSIPSIGPYAIDTKEAEPGGEEAPLIPITNLPIYEKYRKLGIKMNRRSISLHLFTFSPNRCEIPILGIPCELTGGRCNYYIKFDPNLLHSDIFEIISDGLKWNCSMKLRCSDGIVVSKIITNGIITGDQLFFPVLSSSTSILCGIFVTKAIEKARFQAAILWSTGPTGRYIRIFNFSIPTSSDLSSIYSSIDEGALSAYFIKTYTTSIHTVSNKLYRESIIKQFSEILKVVGKIHSFPLLAYSLVTHKMTSDSKSSRIDHTMAESINIRMMTISQCQTLLYPILIDIIGKKKLRLQLSNIKEGIFALQDNSFIAVWGSSKTLEEKSRSFFDEDNKPSQELMEIINSLVETSRKYIDIRLLSSEEGSNYASLRMIEDFQCPIFSNWFAEFMNNPMN